MDVFSIKYELNLELSPRGEMRETRQVQVALAYNALPSGWLARFAASREGRSALPVLLALGLHARPLQGEDLALLQDLGLATGDDAGRLYARVTDVALADELGLYRKTVAGAVAWLGEQRLVRILDLPEAFRDSRGQFAGRRAYVLIADDVLSTVGLEAPRLEVSTVGVETPRADLPTVGLEAPRSDPSSVGVEAPRSDPTVGVEAPRWGLTVGVEAPHRGASGDTKKEEEKEGHVVSLISAAFARVAGLVGYALSEKDQRLLNRLLDDGYTAAEVVQGIQTAIQRHRQRHPDSHVRRFSFCVPVIRERPPRRECDERPRAPESLSVSAVETRLETVLAVTGHAASEAAPSVPDASGDDVSHPPAAAPSETDGGMRGQADVLAAVAEWYRHEIAELTPMTQAELRRLTAEYADLSRWEAAFRASVGIPNPLGRWRYIQTLLSDDGRGGARRLGDNGASARVKRSPTPTQETADALDDVGDMLLLPAPKLPGEVSDPALAEAQQLWRVALDELALQMTRETFNTWLKPTQAMGREDSTLYVRVENRYIQDWLSHRLLPTILRTVHSISGGQITAVRFVTQEAWRVWTAALEALAGQWPEHVAMKPDQVRDLNPAGDTLGVAVGSAEDKVWLEAHLLPSIEQAVSGAAGRALRVTLEVEAASVIET